MYEVTTATKTLLTTASETAAMTCAAEAFKTYKYVEVKKVVTVAPWYAESVQTLMR